MAEQPQATVPPTGSEDGQIITEAKDRFKRAQDWESEFRALAITDTKFANADTDNAWQWDSDLKQGREDVNRPCLTVNKTQQHVLQITNEARKNKPAIVVKPVGEKVSAKAAQIWEGLIRSIERNSGAQTIYDDATESQTTCGIGYFRINHAFVDDATFDQEIVIAPVRDHMSCLLDCDIKQKDGSDAGWGFIFDDQNRKEFEKLNPAIPLPSMTTQMSLDEAQGWITKESVRICEYYRIRQTEDELIWVQNENGESATFKRSEIPERWRGDALDEYEKGNKGLFKKRKIKRRRLEWFKIMGNTIVERQKLAGKYVPIIRIVGREKRIEGKLHRTGIVRALKDMQRMYNYNSSGQVEVVALQTKSPWLVDARAIEGNEDAWNRANVQNASALVWKGWDAKLAAPIPEPKRVDPPVPSSGFMEGMKIASAEMEMVTGQYQAQREQPRLEKTPQAINQRVNVGETATFDFIDNVAIAIRHAGNVIMDLAPHIYDTQRVVKILAKDGTMSDVLIKPDAEEAHQESKSPEEEEVKVLFNPKIGRYAIEADVGPAYASQRQAAWDAFVQIVSSAPELMGVIGDMMFLSADFPNADKIAERLRKEIEALKPYLFDEGLGPQMAKLQADLNNAQSEVAELLQKLAEANLRLRGRDEKRDIESHRAESDRMKVILDKVPLSPDEMRALVHQMVEDALQIKLAPVVEANKDELEQDAPSTGSQSPASGEQGSDGGETGGAAPNGKMPNPAGTIAPGGA